MVYLPSTKWNISNQKIMNGKLFHEKKFMFDINIVRKNNKLQFTRKPAAGMSHNRSAHAMVKVADFKNVEDYVYESRATLTGPEVV